MMPAYATETIVWTCIGAFIICMVAGLLVVTGKWEPKDPVVRKWLLRTVVFVAVGSVVTFAAQLFSGGGRGPEPSPVANESEAPAGDVPKDRLDTKDASKRLDRTPPIDRPREEPIRAVPAAPEEVLSWAENQLGSRPVFIPPANYPDCVATLRDQQAVSRSEARRCRAALELMHLTTIVGFYNLKGTYDTRLELQEESLRGGGINQNELARYNYVVSEMDRLNGDSSSEIAAVHELEEKLLKDIRLCRRSLCQSAE